MATGMAKEATRRADGGMPPSYRVHFALSTWAATEARDVSESWKIETAYSGTFELPLKAYVCLYIYEKQSNFEHNTGETQDV
eukprot:6201220-Pleurochrysis_carterae.AAC.3